MSRAAALSDPEKAELRELVESGLRQYGMVAEDAVDHDCYWALKPEFRDHFAIVRCPCGKRGRNGSRPTAKVIHNVRLTSRPITYRLAIDILRFIDGAKKTSHWRAAHLREEDAWAPRRSFAMQRYARKAGLFGKPGSRERERVRAKLAYIGSAPWARRGPDAAN